MDPLLHIDLEVPLTLEILFVMRMLYHPDLQRMNSYRDIMYQDNKFWSEVVTEMHADLSVVMMMMRFDSHNPHRLLFDGSFC
jgi:hypothetical protein